jgi:hypothetical protein
MMLPAGFSCVRQSVPEYAFDEILRSISLGDQLRFFPISQGGIFKKLIQMIVRHSIEVWI